jgi:phage terminase large subunit-like protein
MPRAPSRGDRAIRFIELYCRAPEGALVGKPMKLEPFQKKFIKAVFDNKVLTRRAILSLARKNGKTALIAALLLVFLVGPEAKRNSQIVSGAMSRDQAGIVHSLAAKMVQLSPELSKIVKIVPSGKRLIGLPLNTEYRALAADGATAVGLSPRVVILDEVGQVRGPRSDFVDALLTAQGAYEDALVLVISTQAPGDTDLLSVWIDDAMTGADPAFVCHLYTAPKECALDDRKAWKASNPALGKFRSVADLENLAKTAMRMPTAEASYRNLNLNQRVEASAPFVTKSVWDANAGEVDHAIFRDRPVYLGIDLSARADLTSIVLAAQDDDGNWHLDAHFFSPAETMVERAKRDRAPYDVWARAGLIHETPGNSVDYDYIAQWLLELHAEGVEIAAGAFDRWRMDVLLQALRRMDAPDEFLELFKPFGQGTKDMSPALDTFEAELLNGRIRHGGHPVLTMCAANTRVWKDSSGNRKFEKQKSSGRIDGMVASAMALGVSAAEADTDEPFVMAL